MGARLARIRAKGLADIFGRLWRGAFGKGGGLNRGGIGLGAGTECRCELGSTCGDRARLQFTRSASQPLILRLASFRDD